MLATLTSELGEGQELGAVLWHVGEGGKLP